MSVYFAFCERLDTVKIGYSGGDPVKRMAALRTACPLPLRLLVVVPDGDLKLERRLHATFRALRLEGEWFSCLGKLQNVLWRLHGGGPEAAVVELSRLYQALGDVLFEGKCHPAEPFSEEEYGATGDRALWPELAGADA
jgi:hypothetical protein